MTSSLENSVKSSLDKSLDDLDSETLQRLQAIRRDALNKPQHKSLWSSLNVWAPATGFALCSLIAAVLWLPQFNQPESQANNQMAMIELIEQADTIEALDDDPGFYLWLDALDEQHG